MVQNKRTLAWYDEWSNTTTPNVPPPTRMVQTAVLSAYTQAKDAHGAETFLRQLEEQAQKGRASPPDVVMYNIVLNAWAKAKNASRARQLLEDMATKKVPTNTMSYNTTINAHVRQGKMKRAECVAREFVESYRSSGRPPPDLATFRSLLAGWTRSRDPKAAERAEQVLIWMRELHQEGILANLPDSRCYQMVLDTCTKSPKHLSGAVAERTLREMIKIGDVCGFSDGVPFCQSDPGEQAGTSRNLASRNVQFVLARPPTTKAYR
jgi:pentatricopeptide repeat protein